jgi:ferredoxin--NADP+ reductase
MWASSLLIVALTGASAFTGAFKTVNHGRHLPLFATPAMTKTNAPGSMDRYGENKAADISRVKGAGGGIPVIQTGDRMLFDPEQEGMLGGTNNLNQRLSEGTDFVYGRYLAPQAATAATPPPNEVVSVAQHWLEDIGEPLVPAAFAKASSPITATVLGRVKLIDDSAPGDIQHVVMKLPKGMHYVEGQSLSVIPPGVDVGGKPHKPRLYSIASTRYGDLLDGSTVSLCVRRAEFVDPATGLSDPGKAGVCSSFLCDAKPGTPVQVAGPVGKTMLLPEDPTDDIIMVATGTGIAPFRAFLHRLFMESTVARHLYQGQAWLILGVPTTGGLLYPEEFAAMQKQQAYPNQLEVTYAISREMTNKDGGKLYVQNVLAEQADKVFARLEGGAHIYFCGLKGMMPGILEALEKVATQKGLDWSAKLKQYQANKQWHVEVY